MPIVRIISGGQTGVDRAALDAAIALQIPHGGWCPRGRLAEDGPIPARMPFRKPTFGGLCARTQQNVLDADATLVLCRGLPERRHRVDDPPLRRHGRPCLVVDLDHPPLPAEVERRLATSGVCVPNVAGPAREPKSRAWPTVRSISCYD